MENNLSFYKFLSRTQKHDFSYIFYDSPNPITNCCYEDAQHSNENFFRVQKKVKVPTYIEIEKIMVCLHFHKISFVGFSDERWYEQKY
jgi:hypothetical protein